MKSYFFLFLTFLLLKSCDHVKKEKDIKPALITETSFKPETICDCNDNGIILLNQILKKRQEFSDVEMLLKNREANEHLEILKKNWKTMQYKCLKTFGAILFKTEGCNDPDKIQALKDKLYDLGVNT